MQAINEIFKAGSLKAMVEKGILKKESCMSVLRMTFHMYWLDLSGMMVLFLMFSQMLLKHNENTKKDEKA